MKKILLLVFIISTIAIGCKQSATEAIEVNTAFTEFIGGFTSGTISVASDLKFRFLEAQDQDENFKLEEPIDSDILKFSPHINGKLYWQDPFTLVFTPDEKMEQNRVYEGNLSLDAILEDIDPSLASFKYSFRTMEQHLELRAEALKAYNKQSTDWQYLSGTVTTRDVAEEEQIKQILTASQEGKELDIQWTHQPNGKIHSFLVDSVNRKDEASEVLLQWSGKTIEAPEDDQLSYKVPALGDFSVQSVRAVDQPDQSITILFSDPLDEQQLLEGLVKLERGSDFNAEIEGNELKIYPSQRINESEKLWVYAGLKNAFGYKLKANESFAVTFRQSPPMVRLPEQKGTILPSTDGVVFPFEAVNLSAVDVTITEVYPASVPQFLQVNNINGNYQMNRVARAIKKQKVNLDNQNGLDLGAWQTYFLDLNDLIEPEAGAVYQISIDFQQAYSLYACAESEDVEEEELAIEDDWNTPQGRDYYYDDWYYDGYYWDDYNYSERNNPCAASYYQYHRPVMRNLVASDLGIVAKTGQKGQLFVAATNLLSAAPQSGTKITVLDFQLQEISSKMTDGDGIAHWKNLERAPFIIKAEQGGSISYLKVSRTQSLDVSRFDVSGKQLNEGRKGFIYGDRGVWRPGDTLHLSFMLEDEQNAIPQGHPIKFEAYNPQGVMVERQVLPHKKNGISVVHMPTSPDDITGFWNGRFKVGNSTFTQSLRVETVKPNRLKIELEAENDRITASKQNPLTLKAKWLHGAPSGPLQARVSLLYSSGNTKFEGYQGYTFDDPARSFNASDQVIFDSRLDEQGSTTLDLTWEGNYPPPGVVNAYLSTKVFENGGDFSVSRKSIPYYPFEEYVGVNMPFKKGRKRLNTDETHEVTITSVDLDGKAIPKQNLSYELFKIDWRWWWENDGNSELRRYISDVNYKPVASGDLKTDKNGLSTFPLKIENEDYGRYYLRVKHPDGHATGEVFYMDWSGWWRNRNGSSDNASMLVFDTDKSKYNVGESCQVRFPSSGTARAMVTIEKGGEVISSDWIKCAEGESTYDFKLTEEMAPNVYVSILMIQPHAQTENDLPIRMYGVMPVFVEDESTHLTPKIEMAESLRPEQDFSVSVSEESGEDMIYTLAIVDEGLLDLTNFKTPEPWSHFYGREALGVNTYDLFNEVIDAYGASLENRASVGGGGFEEESESKKQANRFKPVVMFAGPYTVKAGKTAKHDFQMPNYIGSVRVMLVGRNAKAYGSAEKAVPVKQPVMVLGTLPRVAGPKETLDLQVTVFAMEDYIKNVDIKVESNALFDQVGASQKQVKFNDVGDQVVTFPLRVKAKTGIATVKVTATSGKETATYEVEMQVRNPNPEVVQVLEESISKNGEWNTTFDLTGVEGTNSIALELSSFPPIDLGRRLNYLTGYPHGCVEQTTSKAFPQLYLPMVVEMSENKRITCENNVNAALKRLAKFQTTDGGLSYWPGGSESSSWGSNYAGHFMIEAEALGYGIPVGLKKAWLNYQKQQARSWQAPTSKQNYYESSQLVQAYRLYTLALAKEPEMGAMNRFKELDNLCTQAVFRLAAAYELVGQSEIAASLISGKAVRFEPDPSTYYYSYGSATRDLSMVLETMVLMERESDVISLSRDIAREMSEQRWMSTQTTAYALLALSKAMKSFKSEEVQATVSYNGSTATTYTTGSTIMLVELSPEHLTNNRIAVENKTDSPLYARLMLAGKPARGKEVANSNSLEVAVRYVDMEGNSLNPQMIEQGTDFKALVTVSHPGIRGYYRDLSLTQIFPSGWEIVNSRMDAIAGNEDSGYFTYQDIRDDRLYTYFDLGRRESRTFTVLLNASYTGSYYLPAVQCEAMYDNSIYANTKGQEVSVVKAGEATSSN